MYVNIYIHYIYTCIINIYKNINIYTSYLKGVDFHLVLTLTNEAFNEKI